MRSDRHTRIRRKPDWLTPAELALMGPILHVDRRLVNRIGQRSVIHSRSRAGVVSIPSEERS